MFWQPRLGRRRPLLATGEAGIPATAGRTRHIRNQQAGRRAGGLPDFPPPAFPIPLVNVARQGQIWREPDG